MSLCSPFLLQCVCSSFLCSRDRCSVMVLGMLVSLWHNKFTSLDPCLALAFCFSCEQAFCLNLVLSSLGLPLGLQWAFIWNKKTKRIKPKAKPSCIITRQYKCRCFSTNPSLIILIHFVKPEYLTPSLTFIVQNQHSKSNQQRWHNCDFGKLNCDWSHFFCLFEWVFNVLPVFNHASQKTANQ